MRLNNWICCILLERSELEVCTFVERLATDVLIDKLSRREDTSLSLHNFPKMECADRIVFRVLFFFFFPVEKSGTVHAYHAVVPVHRILRSAAHAANYESV